MTTTPSPGDPGSNPIFKAIYDLVTSVPLSGEPTNSEPKSRAESIVELAAKKSSAIAAGMALPPGPYGMLTVIPDLILCWRIQRQMVSDIAACYGKHPILSQELMAYCLFRHGAETIVSEVVVRVGERYLVRRVPVLIFVHLIQKLSVRISQRFLGRFVSRWIPVLGALAIGAYAYREAKLVGATTIDVFSRDIEVENKDGEIGDKSPEV